MLKKIFVNTSSRWQTKWKKKKIGETSSSWAEPSRIYVFSSFDLHTLFPSSFFTFISLSIEHNFGMTKINETLQFALCQLLRVNTMALGRSIHTFSFIHSFINVTLLCNFFFSSPLFRIVVLFDSCLLFFVSRIHFSFLLLLCLTSLCCCLVRSAFWQEIIHYFSCDR